MTSAGPLQPADDAPPAMVLLVGDEILSGEVRDAHLAVLADRIFARGGRVVEARVVPDEPVGLRRHLRALLAAAPRLLVIAGGLGPTPDDGTAAALADAAGRPLEEHPAALEQVARFYADGAANGSFDGAELDAARRSQAALPRGAAPLANPVGAAPGVLLDLESTRVVLLPGVPSELHGILSGPGGAALDAALAPGARARTVLVVGTGDESVLAADLAAVGPAHPGVRLKSRAVRSGPGVRLGVTVDARGDDAEVARERMEAACGALERALRKRGLEVAREESGAGSTHGDEREDDDGR